MTQPMRLETKIYPVTEDHGTRFARMWELYHRAPESPLTVLLWRMIGALAGLFAAAVVVAG